MGIISLILLVIFIIAAIIMVLVILMQDDQGEGIAGMFGGGATTPVGSRSGNVLTRFTSILAAIFIVGAFALAWLNRTPESSDILERARVERLKQSESQDWWVERVQEPAQAQTQPQASAAEGAAGPATSGEPTAEAAGAGGAATETGSAQGEQTQPVSAQDTVPESINR